MRNKGPAFIPSKQLARDFPPTRRYLIGVSGGRDSVALLHSLVDLGYTKLIVCHLDHQLRGRSAKADAKFAEKLSANYDLDFVSRCKMRREARRELRSRFRTRLDQCPRAGGKEKDVD